MQTNIFLKIYYVADGGDCEKRVVAVVAVIVLLVGASVASIIYMKSGKMMAARPLIYTGITSC